MAYWFFRLNGCLTTANFLVHQEARHHRPTEADVLAVRFPFRREFARDPMEDHALFLRQSASFPTLFLVEVKAGKCELNGPWTDRAQGNMQRLLRAVGLLPEGMIEEAADALYSRRRYEADGHGCARLVAVGDRLRSDWTRRGYEVEQLLWDDILTFVHDRFTRYADPKRQNSQWEDFGRRLYRHVVEHPDPLEFMGVKREHLGLPRREE